ncbi:hypothetical protein HDV05_007054 [Chytridiales sp. JEL 0842]|nr:hypothetical protein HDV05_007054 [Chytridiales sp. JEL 0842]
MPETTTNTPTFTFKDPNEPWPYREPIEVITNPNFYIPWITSAVACFMWYSTAMSIWGKHLTTERSRAWIMTLLSAVVMVIGGSQMAYEAVTLPEGATMVDAPSLDSPKTWALSSFLIAYFTVDLIIGTMSYPSQIGIISGWFHHLGYGYCVFAILQRGQAGNFITFASMLEVPTIVLALGHINKNWRQDLLFGMLFFLTRVVLHGWVVYYAYNLYTGSSFWIVPAIPYVLHIHWLYGWIKQQRRLAAKKKTEEKKE